MNCDAICLCNSSLYFGDVLIMKPCHHRIHKRCWEKYSEGEPEMPCPYCGYEIQEQEALIRRQNKKYSIEDRARVLRAAEEGRDWLSVAESLEVKRTTAEAWINSGEKDPKPRGGDKRGMVTEDIKEKLIDALEEDSQLTLKQLKEKLMLTMSESTISRALHGLAFTFKGVHYEPNGMNTEINKRKRMEYVQELQILMEESK